MEETYLDDLAQSIDQLQFENSQASGSENVKAEDEEAVEETSSPHWRHLWDYQRIQTDVEDTPKPSFLLPTNLEIASHNDFPSVEDFLIIITEFLDKNYVEDEDGNFRFSYKPEHIKWAMLESPDNLDLLIILRTTDSKKIVGFIAACPCNVIAYRELYFSAIIDFVCVHKEHRKLRICPLLYSIIYSKLYERGIFTSLKTTDSDISFPVAEVQYYHLSLNEERLIQAGFAYQRQRVLPDLSSHPELSVLCPSDLPSAFELLNWYSECFLLAQQFLSPSHLGHVLLPREDLVFTLVKRTKRPNNIDLGTYLETYYDSDSDDSVETNSLEAAANCEGGIETVTDLVSVYFVQNQILTEGNPLQGECITTAYLFYLSAVTMFPEELILAVAFEAKRRGADVLTILPIGHITKSTCQKVQADPSTGFLKYYTYNFDNIRSPFNASDMFIFPAI